MKSPEERILDLLKLVAEEYRPCKLCGMGIYMVRHRTGKLTPYTPEGLNHFIDCPHAEKFRKAKA